jgi:hypothetical protein
VKLGETESPPGLPLTTIVYDPVATLATVNAPVNAPPDTEQVSEATGVPEIEHELSAVEKPEPDT